MKDIIFNLIPELKGKNDDYTDAIIRRFRDYIEYSQIPEICLGFDDNTIIPDKLDKVVNNMLIAVKERYNFLFNFSSYENLSYLSYLLITYYFKQCILNDETVENILYIDTKLMVEDYKRLINYDKNELSLAPVHSLETLYKNIENAPLVIWDKFMMIDSAYDKDKIYDILCIRHRKGLANFYFSINGTSELSKVMGPNISNEICQYLDTGFNCSLNKINIKHTKEVSLFK